MFSYEVDFRWSEVRWASRWNVYLEMADLNIHWFSIVNSVIVVFFLAGQFHTFCLSCSATQHFLYLCALFHFHVSLGCWYFLTLLQLSRFIHNNNVCNNNKSDVYCLHLLVRNKEFFWLST